MPDAYQPLTSLPDDARARYEAFMSALERISVGDMPMYATTSSDAARDRARDAAKEVARERRLESQIGAAREQILEFVALAYREAGVRIGFLGTAPSVGFGENDDRIRVMQSLADAVYAIILDDALRDDDRAELIGAWDGLVPE